VPFVPYHCSSSALRLKIRLAWGLQADIPQGAVRQHVYSPSFLKQEQVEYQHQPEGTWRPVPLQVLTSSIYYFILYYIYVYT
jgi:hypothetical protein